MIITYDVKCTKCGQVSFLNVPYVLSRDSSYKKYIKDRLLEDSLIKNCNCDCLENDALNVYNGLSFSIEFK